MKNHCSLDLPKINKITAFDESICLVSAQVTPPVHAKDYWCDENQFYLDIHGIAKYHVNIVENILTIEVYPELTNLDAINTWLYGTVFAYILQFKGYLVLHGSAVLVNGCAVVFSGDSGAGKSTTAVALVNLGYPLLTDDVVAIKYTAAGQMVLVPGPSRVKLWQDTLVRFGRTADGLKQVSNKDNKYELFISNYHAELVPICQFYELTKSEDCNQIRIIEQSGSDKLANLIRNTYRYSMLRPMNKLPAHFVQIAQLAALIKVYVVVRPSQQFLLDELLQQIIDRF